MPRTLALVAALLLGLIGLTPAALAADSPAPGTPACDVLVAADATVAETTSTLTVVRSSVQSTPQEIADAEQAREDAVAAATATLCLGTDPVDPTDPTDPVDPTTPPVEQPAGPTVAERVAAVRVEIDALSCEGLGEKLGRIQDEQRALIGDATGQQLGALSDALNARLRVLGFCAGTVGPTTSTPAPGTTTVTDLPDVDESVEIVHTDDDDSTATATQVREVPEGLGRDGLGVSRAVAGLVALLALLVVAASCASPAERTPDGSPASGEVREGFSLSIAKLGIDGAPLAPVGLNADRTIQTPPVEQPEQAAVYTGGPMPGEVGPAVVLGHVNGAGRPGVFARLDELAAGDEVTTTGPDGSPRRFVVYRVVTVEKTDFPTAQVYSDTPGPELRLITCGGALDRSARSYVGQVIVFARAVP